MLSPCLPERGQSAVSAKAFDSTIAYSMISEWDSEGLSNSRHLSIAFFRPDRNVTDQHHSAAQNLLQQGRREFGCRGVLFLYVEEDGRLRTKLEGIFSSRLQLPDGALEDGHLGHGISGGLKLRADLVFEVTGVPDFVEEEVEETLGGQQGLSLQLFDGLVAHRHITAADVEDDVVVAISPEPFKP
jgi:hypothetical protein